MNTGFTAGTFDLLHAGHILFLGECSKKCDKLVVGLHVNPRLERESKNKPIQTVFERYIQLSACKYVYKVIPYETEQDLMTILANAHYNVRFLGSEYEDEEITGRELVPIQYIYRTHLYSSRELRERIKKS